MVNPAMHAANNCIRPRTLGRKHTLEASRYLHLVC